METLITENWSDYSLIDSGNKKRLESIGGIYVVRPEPTALWEPHTPNHKGWLKPHAEFTGDRHQPWNLQGAPAEGWSLTWNGIKVRVKPTPFKHVGIFPEQAAHWEWIEKAVVQLHKTLGRKVRVLNLFGYTGMASLVAAKAGAEVCHVDAAKNTVQWASENAHANNLEIRWIVDDALKFLQREQRRNSRYDLVIMDPPVFGRGPKGEIWRLEEQLMTLLGLVNGVVSGREAKVLMNFYATEIYPYAIAHASHQALTNIKPLTLAALCLKEEGGTLLQTGYSLRS
jgi:23S rRNA (cytosine1962-C5)-methyltransferase